jgi:thermitase
LSEAGYPVLRFIAVALAGLLVLSAVLSGGWLWRVDDAGAGVVRPCPTSGGTAHGVTVAVVDSGVTLISQLSTTVDRAASRSFVVGEPLGQDDVHGTEMASIIHAGAPGARLLVLKALDDQDGGRLTATVAAIRYAVAHRARVINLSAAGAEPSAALHGAIADAEQHDDLVVVAAGNDGFDDDRYPMYPADYREPNLVSVAATNGQGDLVANSDWGVRTVTLAALGQEVLADTPSGAVTTVSGTSPATALVSAAAATLLSGDPALTARALRRQLIDTSRRSPGLRGEVLSGGQLDPARLLDRCAAR